ncbi:MAG: fused MFS/spermidine synthase [SAR324 cluster bacterium]|nr:fused MFS/spermidine synthase [SAR324 cluster bacterium]
MVRLIYGLFVVSGFVGLIYESLWSRYLKLFLGHSFYGQILTLSIFMGGLGIGSFLAGRLCRNIRNPFYVYAAIELLVGVSGFVFHGIYLVCTQWFYEAANVYFSSFWFANLTKVLISMLMTLPTAILLGMTFPFITVGVIRVSRDEGRSSLPVLYFTNSLGAAIGILATSYLLIPEMGTIGTLAIAGSSNVLIALMFYFIAKKADKIIGPKITESFSGAESHKEISHELPDQRTIGLWLLISGLTGFSSFIYEVGWIRLLGLLLGSSTHSFDIMISAFILGLALGGGYARKLIDSSRNIAHTLAFIQILMGAFALSSIYFYEPFFYAISDSHSVFRKTELAYPVYSIFKYLICLLMMAPTSFFAGMTLPLITYYLINFTRNEKYTGFVYGWNTIGAILGASLGGLLLLPNFQIKYTIASGALIDIGLGLVLLGAYKLSRWKFIATLCVSVLVFIPVLHIKLDPNLTTIGVFRGKLNAGDFHQILVKDGKTATISFTFNPFRSMIATNGKVDASIGLKGTISEDEYTQAAAAFVPMAAMNQPYDAAMIGLGSGMSAHYLLSDPLLKHLDLIEIEEQMYELAKNFYPYNRNVYDSPKIRPIFDDAKTYFYQANRQYDLIISEPSNPWVSGVSSLFTEEFYEHIQRFLKPEGLLVQWVHGYSFNTELMLTIIKALDNRFPYAKIYLAGEANYVIVAGNTDFNLDAIDRFEREPEIAQEFLKFKGDTRLFGPQNFIVSTQSLRPILEDVNPNSYFFPLVDNSAEKALFLSQEVDLFWSFINAISFYQEILEPENFSRAQTDYFKNAPPIPSEKLEWLTDSLRIARKNSNWNEIDHQFKKITHPRNMAQMWDKLEAVTLYRELVRKDIPPKKFQDEFLFLDFLYTDQLDHLKDLIRNILQNSSPPKYNPVFLSAMEVEMLKAGEKAMYLQIFQTFIMSDTRFPPHEKKLLSWMGNHFEELNRQLKERRE